MNRKEFGKKIKELRESFTIRGKDLSEKIGISQSRLSQLENGEVLFKNEDIIYKHISNISELLSNHPNNINKYSKNHFEQELSKALYKNQESSENDLKKDIIKIMNHFKSDKDDISSTGFNEMVEYIKINLSDYYHDTYTKHNLKNLLGLYEMFEFSASQKHIITKRHLFIFIDPETKAIRAIKSCPPPLDIYSYKEHIGTIKRLDDTVYIDLIESRGLEECRIVFSTPLEKVKYLSGISLDLTQNKEPLSRYVVLKKCLIEAKNYESEYQSQKRHFEQYEKETLVTYKENEFSILFPDIHNYLINSEHHKLIGKRYSSTINFFRGDNRYYISFAYSTTERNKISLNTLEIFDDTKYILNFPDNICIRGTLLNDSGSVTVIRALDMLIAFNKLPTLQYKSSGEHNVLTGIQTFFSDSRKSVRSNKVILLRIKDKASFDKLKTKLNIKYTTDNNENNDYSFKDMFKKDIYNDIHNCKQIYEKKANSNKISEYISSFLMIEDNVIHSILNVPECDIFNI